MGKQIKERVEIGKDAQGKPVYKWASGQSVREMHDAIARLYVEHGLIEGIMPVAEATEVKHSATFKEYADNWLAVYKAPKLKPTTYRGYVSMLSAHLYPTFGNIPICDITTEEVQRFLNKRKSLAFKTLHTMMMFLGEIFKDALEDGIIQKNPTASRKLVIPSTKKTERNALTQAQLVCILQSVRELEAQDKRLMALLLLTGMRRGEVLGLRWEDIDVEAGLIYVRRNVTFPHNQPHIGTPKTEKGKRTIPLDDQLWDLLQPALATGYIIGNEQPISDMAYKRTWQRITKRVELYGATAYVFRHSYLTMASNAGVTPKTLQAIGGHADIATTMNRYVHAQRDQILDAGRKISQKFRFEDNSVS